MLELFPAVTKHHSELGCWDTGIRMAFLTRSSASIPQQGPLMLSVVVVVVV